MTRIVYTLTALTLFACLIASCGKKAEKITTGVSLLPIAVLSIQPGITGSESYAEVQSSALPGFESDLQAELSHLGVVGWQTRADCKEFARLYIAVAQARYANAAFYSFELPPELALAEVWYVKDNGKDHAIVAAITEKGLTFVEPQTGDVIALSDAERDSINFCRW
jgi:hypothetical protein